jgi:hypothetical protein
MPQIAESEPASEPTAIPEPTPAPTPMPTPEPVVTFELIPEPLTPREMFAELFPGEDYDETLDVLAKVLYGESRGVYDRSVTNCACVIWCIGNRVDAEKRGDNFRECSTSKSQFTCYKKRNPVQDHLRNLAEDVLTRWLREKFGEENVGRILPKEYIYFAAHHGYNRFRTARGNKLTPKVSAVYEGD